MRGRRGEGETKKFERPRNVTPWLKEFGIDLC